MLDLKAYFERIGIGAPKDNTLEALSAIHQAHLLSIPFDNLDVYLKGKIYLDLDNLMTKLVHQKRGGWCFEQNGLYFAVLKVLGFEARSIMARSLTSANRPRTHQVILVKIGNEVHLTDIGFGGQPMRGPLKFEAGIQVVAGQSYKLESYKANSSSVWDEPELWKLYTLINNEWSPSYEFTTESFTQADFRIANHFHVSASVSSFHDSWFITKPSASGRISLVSGHLKIYKFNKGIEIIESEEQITTSARLDTVLREYFSIALNKAELEKLLSKTRPPIEIDSGF